MAVWRRKAIEAFPDLREDLNDPDFGVYGLFLELSCLLPDAHKARDFDRLKAIYTFAYWCSKQSAQPLWNSAGVSFYEHVFDDWKHRKEVVQWLAPDVVADCWDLWEFFLSEKRLEEVRRLLANRSSEHWRHTI